MNDDLTARIVSDPHYQQLKVGVRASAGGSRWPCWSSTTASSCWWRSTSRSWPRRLGEGVTTIGMPIGLGVIVFTIVITGIYVRRANSEYDALTEQITRGALK